VAGSEPGRSVRFYVRELEGGKLRPVTPKNMEVYQAEKVLSPDGQWLAASEAGKKACLYPVDGGEPRPIAGLADGETPIQWSADGHSLFVRRRDETPPRIDKLDLATGRHELWKQIMPSDSTGVVRTPMVLPSRDGRAYAYSYLRILSDLYIAEGLK
jgi:hypothetical protein